MDITLPRDLDDYVREKLAAGQYGSAAELICEALRTLRKVELAVPSAEEDLRREIDLGLREIEEGRVVEWDVAAMKRRICQPVQGKKAS